MLIRDLGLMAAAVYNKPGADGVADAAQVARLNAQGSLWDAFQAAAYMKDGQLAIIFRGTSAVGDLVTDAALGTGMNSAYYEQAEAFVKAHATSNAIVCGHSLGGAIAQIVGNRLGLPIVTFNAPGVAVVASRNVATADPAMSGIRMAGMLASAVVKPGQALKDLKAVFNVVKGINICLANDLVSRIGLHYGRVERIPGLYMNPKKEHSIDTVNLVLKNHSLGKLTATF